MKWTLCADSLGLPGVLFRVECHRMITLIAIKQIIHLYHSKQIMFD